MRCSFWELRAIIAHEKLRYEAEFGAESPRGFGVPTFVTDSADALGHGRDPVAMMADAEASARDQGWITPTGRLNDRWHEIVTTLAQGQAYGFVRITDPGADATAAETRAVVAVQWGSAYRFVLQGPEVRIDEVRSDAPWPALVGCLPTMPAAQGRPVTVPSAVLTKAERDSWIAYDVLAGQVALDDAQMVAELTEMADQVTAQLTIALQETNSTLHVGPYAIDVHHAPSGRVAVLPQLPEGARTTVAPADRSLIVTAIQEYLDDLWAQMSNEPTKRLA